MPVAEKLKLTFADYLAREAGGDLRHEFLHGETFAMAGGTPEHAALIVAVAGTLYRSVKAPCRAFSEALRIQTPSGKVAYPDVFVVCGPLRRHPEDDNTITNPTLIVEVLSDGTEAYDRGEKFRHYRSAPSLVEYILISSRGVPVIERFERRADEWVMASVGPGESMSLRTAEVSLVVDEIYAGFLDESGFVSIA